MIPQKISSMMENSWPHPNYPPDPNNPGVACSSSRAQIDCCELRHRNSPWSSSRWFDTFKYRRFRDGMSTDHCHAVRWTRERLSPSYGTWQCVKAVLDMCVFSISDIIYYLARSPFVLALDKANDKMIRSVSFCKRMSWYPETRLVVHYSVSNHC